MLKNAIAQFVLLREWVLSLLVFMGLSVAITVFILRMVFGDLYVVPATAAVVFALIGVSLELMVSMRTRHISEIALVDPERVVSHYFFIVTIVSTYMGIPFYFFWCAP